MTIYGVGTYSCVIFHHLAVIQCAAAIAVYNSCVLDRALGDTHMFVTDQEFHVRVGGWDQPADISLEFHIRVGGETNLLIFPPWSFMLGWEGRPTC